MSHWAICPCLGFAFAFIFWHSRATIESRFGFRYGGMEAARRLSELFT
jgi:hypothetical protein